MKNIPDLTHLFDFLACRTPMAWCEQAKNELSTLLIDHAHCEKKAASSAIAMLFRYPEKEELIYALSRIAREELRHFEQVIAILKKRKIPFQNMQPARYADGLMKHVSNHEPARLIDLLIVSAFIEARSCERFATIIPYLDDELKSFYSSLLLSEARHYELYLKFANLYSGNSITDRIEFFRTIEGDLIQSEDNQFRFHSGIK